MIEEFPWGLSSSGRALALQARGGRFKSDSLHSGGDTHMYVGIGTVVGILLIVLLLMLIF